MIRHEVFTDAERQLVADRLTAVRRQLVANTRKFQQHPVPLLLAGDAYPGIWLEHNHDNLFLAPYAPEEAWASQVVFMDYQRPDGLLPFNLPLSYGPTQYFKTPATYSHVQAVWSFARCALEIARATSRPERDLQRLYDAAVRYDQWFVANRNRANTGLVEMYCEWDTGHDNSPRVTDDGIPHACPGNDAANMPDLPCMPILSVDLSAMLYGHRTALADIADLLGRHQDAQQWRDRAETTRRLINQYLYDPEDDFFYDRSPNGFRKYRTEHITRLFLNQVLTQQQFDSIYQRYFETPGREFNPAFPIPAVSVDDPHFVQNAPSNCWGAHSQANTAVRALLWMPHYGRHDDLLGLLSVWLRAFLNGNCRLTQEISPFDGHIIGEKENYTPAIILFLKAAELVLNLQ